MVTPPATQQDNKPDRAIVWAYLISPLGAVAVMLLVPFALPDVSSGRVAMSEVVHDVWLLTVATLGISYVVGLFLLPFYWLYKKIGWAGWQYYVPTAAVAGVIYAWISMGAGDGPKPPVWMYVCLGANGAASGIVFSLVLRWRRKAR